MMTLKDALNNWLQLKLVVDRRPGDEAAGVSLEHVTEILKNEYKIEIKEVSKENEFYKVSYYENGETIIHKIPEQSAEVLLTFINENPERYDFTER